MLKFLKESVNSPLFKCTDNCSGNKKHSVPSVQHIPTRHYKVNHLFIEDREISLAPSAEQTNLRDEKRSEYVLYDVTSNAQMKSGLYKESRGSETKYLLTKGIGRRIADKLNHTFTEWLVIDGAGKKYIEILITTWHDKGSGNWMPGGGERRRIDLDTINESISLELNYLVHMRYDWYGDYKPQKVGLVDSFNDYSDDENKEKQNNMLEYRIKYDNTNGTIMIYSDKYWFKGSSTSSKPIEDEESGELDVFPQGTHFFYDSSFENSIHQKDLTVGSFEEAFKKAKESIEEDIAEHFRGQKLLDIQFSRTCFWRGCYVEARAIIEQETEDNRIDVSTRAGYGIDGDSFTKLEAIKEAEKKLLDNFSLSDSDHKCFIDDVKTYNVFSEDIKDTRWYAEGKGRGFLPASTPVKKVKVTWGCNQEDERGFHRAGATYGYRETLFSEEEAIRDARAYLRELYPNVTKIVAYPVHDGENAFAGFYGVAIGYLIEENSNPDKTIEQPEDVESQESQDSTSEHLKDESLESRVSILESNIKEIKEMLKALSERK